MLTKENIEAVSNLIQACRNIGATYKEDHILFADGTGVTLSDLGWAWEIHRQQIHKDRKVKQLTIRILEIHLKILRKNLA